MLIAAQSKASEQLFTISEELAFSHYLIQNSEYDDAINVLKKINLSQTTAAQSDSINYMLGWSHYMLNNPDSAQSSFKKVSSTSTFYPKSLFYKTYCLISLDRHKEAYSAINKSIIIHDTAFSELIHYQLAAISLLERNFQKFDSISSVFPFKKHSHELDKLHIYRSQLANTKNKSPLLAALFSAIIPGSGKLYSGNKGQAFASFVYVGINGVVTLESFLKAGITGHRFIIFGSLFSIFYSGNIYGSAVAAIHKNKLKQEENNDQIIGDLRSCLINTFK